MRSATHYLLFFACAGSLVWACGGDSSASFANAGGNGGSSNGTAGNAGTNSGGNGSGGQQSSAGGNGTGASSTGGNGNTGGSNTGGSNTGGSNAGASNAGGNGNTGGSNGNGGGLATGGNSGTGGSLGTGGAGGAVVNCLSCNAFITACYIGGACPAESQLCPAATASYGPMKTCICNTCSASCALTCTGAGVDSNPACQNCIGGLVGGGACAAELNTCSMN